jgi:DNA-binding transcriptional MerR regulator
LLYYASIDLLPPSGRSQANYRLYTDADMKRLERICAFKEAGVSLGEIKQILRLDDSLERSILEKTMVMLNTQVRSIREKQARLSSLLQEDEDSEPSSFLLDTEFVVSALRAAGFDGNTLLEVHKILEGESPKKHRKFLDLLGLSEDEVAYILEKLPPLRETGEQ